MTITTKEYIPKMLGNTALLYISPFWWFLERDTRGTRLLRRRSHSARLCWNWCSVERNRRSRRGLDQPRWKPCTARTSRVKTTREFTHRPILSSPLLFRADLGIPFFPLIFRTLIFKWIKFDVIKVQRSHIKLVYYILYNIIN